jgi:exodeoxyribonuclease VII small subunit
MSADKSKANDDIKSMSYEQARDELGKVVSALEAGAVTLEESMNLWERGEALAKRCEEWLSGARKRLDDALAEKKAQ